ncbi:MAG: polymer-forming cytoskeletal protein [Pseudomonadota bacterium]
MLKTLMHPGTSGNARTESNRPGAAPQTSGRVAEAGKPAETIRAETAQSAPNDEGSKLIVGPNIKLKGSEITDCEILVVEGRVEASMNSRDIRIAEGGVFSGTAEIDVAEVRGTFEGELTARRRLVVYATGRVNGTIRYGALMVEEGGIISGNVAMHDAAPARARVQEMPRPAEPDAEAAPNLEQLPSARGLAGGRAS